MDSIFFLFAVAVEHQLDLKGHQTKAVAIGVTISLIILVAVFILVVYLLVNRKLTNTKIPSKETFKLESEATDLLTKAGQNKKIEVVYL